MVKNLLAIQQTWVLSLGQKDPPEKEMATQLSILDWRTSWTEEPEGLQSLGWQKVGDDSSILAWRILLTEQSGGLPSMRSQRAGHD